MNLELNIKMLIELNKDEIWNIFKDQKKINQSGSLKKDFRVFKYILKTKLLFLRRRRTDDKSDCGRY